MWKDSTRVTNLALNFTNKCNLKCEYCYLFSKQQIDHEDISVEDLIELTKKTFKYFPNISMVELWGGEPTLDADRLLEFSQAMRSIKVDVWAPSTNGTLLGVRKNFEAWRSTNGSRGGQVSFDGNKKFHDKYRCNTHDLVVKNLKNCINLGSQPSLRTTYRFEDFFDAIKENMTEFPKLYKEFLDECPNTMEVDKTFAIYPYKDRKLMMIYQEVDSIYTKEGILKRAPIYREYFEKLDNIIDEFLDNDVILMPPYIGDTIQALTSGKDTIDAKNCGSFVNQVYLHTSTGDIYPCLSEDVEQYQNIACLMNIHSGIINWPVVNTVRAFMYRRNRGCFKCFLQSSCFGACFHRTVDEPDPGNSSAFTSYWNTAYISKCIFSHSVFDIVVKTSQRIIDYIDKSFGGNNE